MAGIYNRDNLGAQLPAGLEAALARHQATTDRNNARTASNMAAITRGAEGIVKDLHRDELMQELADLRRERESLDDEDDFERLYDKDADKQAENEFADAIQQLEDEWVDKRYGDMLRKNKLMGVNNG